MNPWIETLIAILACLISAWICSRVARFESAGWWLAYLIPLTVVVGYGVFVRRPDLALHPALSWILIGRWRYTLVGVAVAGLLSTLRAKLPKPQDRRALLALTVVTLVYVSLWPTLASAFNQEYLRSLRTQIDRDGVCRQHTDYTCGPAAAVTALLRVRIRADEGDLAVQARTSTATGTPPDVLAQTLNRQFGRQGVQATLRRIDSLDELRRCGLTLVVLNYSLIADHWMCVFRVTDESVIVGDPVSGRTRMSHAEFLRRFRRIGIVISRSDFAVL